MSTVDPWRSYAHVRPAAFLAVALLSLAAFADVPIVGAAPPTPPPPGINAAVLATTPTGPVVVNGTLQDSTGRSTSGQVAALAWPDQQFLTGLASGQSFTEPTVGWGRAGTNGRFALQVDPGRVPAGYVTPSGQVNIHVVGWAGKSVGRWAVSAQLSAARAATPGAAPAATVPDVVVRLNSALTGSSAALPTGGGGCTSDWVSLGTQYPTQQTGETLPYPGNPVSAQFTITNSESMDLGVAVSSTGAYGSWSAGGTNTITNGATHTYAASTADQAYYTTDRYDEYKDLHHFCETQLPQYEYWNVSNTGSGWSGSEPYPYWGNRVYESPQTFSRIGGSNFQLSAGVNLAAVIGINLSVSESYSTNYSASYSFPNGGYMCGSDSTPGNATRIEQCAPPSPNGTTLYANQTLSGGQYLLSDNSRYELLMQGDGNLVLYSPTTYLWASWTQNHPNDFVLMQGDGNLVIYRQGGTVADWASGTSGYPGAWLLVQGDGNLVIYRQGGVAIWSSNTCCNRS